MVIQLFYRLGEFILFHQNRNPRVFVNFTHLAVRWQLRRAKERTLHKDDILRQHVRALHCASVNFDIAIVHQSIAKTKEAQTHLKNRLEQLERVLERF